MGFNINSGNIKVFPCGGRDSKFDPLAKLPTEYNLVSIINRLVDQCSFVVSDVNPNNTTGNFLFNIGGYLFELNSNGLKELVSAGTINEYVVATIKTSGTSSGSSSAVYVQLTVNTEDTVSVATSSGTGQYAGQLDAGNGKFTGILFTLANKEETADEQTLTLFKITSKNTTDDTNKTPEEIDQAKKAIKILGGSIEKIDSFDLFDCGERTIINVKKISSTPGKYPRPSAKMAKFPLE